MSKAALKNEVRVNTVQAKNNLNELIASLDELKQPIVIEKRGSPVAMLVKYQEGNANLKQTNKTREKSELELYFKELETYYDYMKKFSPKQTTDSAELLREIREERMNELLP